MFVVETRRTMLEEQLIDGRDGRDECGIEPVKKQMDGEPSVRNRNVISLTVLRTGRCV